MTPEKAWREKFIKQLATTGNVADACRKAKVARGVAYRERDEDEQFKAAWEEALEIATENLELEARRRAEHGYLDPVYFMGAKVGSVRRYSDTLLIFLLKAHKPDKYRDSVKHVHGGAVGEPIQHKVEHGIDGDTATTIFDILAGAGAFQPGADGAEDDGVHPPQAD